MTGPGVEQGLLSTKPTHFMVDARKAGKGDTGLSVAITDEAGKGMSYQLQDNMDDTYAVRTEKYLLKPH